MVALFRFAFVTGMRALELARMRWSHVDAERRVIHIPMQKARRPGIIPLSRKAEEVLDEVRQAGSSDGYVFRAPRQQGAERPAFKNYVGSAFALYRDRAGIGRPVTFHGLRHGFCTTLAEAGKSAVVIKEAARHAHISTSMLYVHLTQAHIRAELDDVFSRATTTTSRSG